MKKKKKRGNLSTPYIPNKIQNISEYKKNSNKNVVMEKLNLECNFSHGKPNGDVYKLIGNINSFVSKYNILSINMVIHT